MSLGSIKEFDLVGKIKSYINARRETYVADFFEYVIVLSLFYNLIGSILNLIFLWPTSSETIQE